MRTDPIPDSLRYRVLKESGGRCSLCGATNKERLLDVDHIKPRLKGGKNTYESFQALCSKCNRSKGNKDDTDFRGDIVESVEELNSLNQKNTKATSRVHQNYGSIQMDQLLGSLEAFMSFALSQREGLALEINQVATKEKKRKESIKSF